MDERLRNILMAFDVKNVSRIEQIYKSAWSVDDSYILKRNSNPDDLNKSIALSDKLIDKNIPVPKYYRTSDGRPLIMTGNECYCLMRKLHGVYLDPYIGNARKNGKMLGNIIAKLHYALQAIEGQKEYYDSNYIAELSGWIMTEIEEKKIEIQKEIIDDCFAYESLYSVLPRQLIHRDMHLGNLLFDDGEFVGYLDFDNSQKNVRILDICYLGASMLVGNYQDNNRLEIWHEIFRGVLDGYHQLLPLDRNEKEAVPTMFVLIELTFTAFFSKIGQPATAQNCIDMTNWLYDNKKYLQEVIS